MAGTQNKLVYGIAWETGMYGEEQAGTAKLLYVDKAKAQAEASKLLVPYLTQGAPNFGVQEFELDA